MRDGVAAGSRFTSPALWPAAVALHVVSVGRRERRLQAGDGTPGEVRFVKTGRKYTYSMYISNEFSTYASQGRDSPEDLRYGFAPISTTQLVQYI